MTPHRVFGRKGDNLTLDVPVSFDEAALGGEVKIPTLGGAPVTLKLPPGTPNGRTFRVRGKGATRRDGTKGDLLATVEVQVPATLDPTAERGPRGLSCGHGRQAAPQRALRLMSSAFGSPVARRRRLRHQRGGRADRAAPADPARLRADGPDRPRSHGGGGRRYSHRDLERLREIADLTSAGIGIEGVRRIMELEHQIDALRARNEELVAELDAVRRGLAARAAASQPANKLPVLHQAVGQSMVVWRRPR